MAAAPFLAAAIWTIAGDYAPVVWVPAGVSTISALSFGIAASLVRFRRKAAPFRAEMKKVGS
jgi:hypothetical protein